ncbi:carbohydrate ABC transporter permease [Gryllotalpicola ginsengisoli]|uniref:carbohydrate ABC transporter permease n=1 Tax=Gryllotalpicola ginsengisoli TaxID=444608 RepID=UPI0003B3157B|nr:sugar ABC transporter permease [Gryllotalpicola ginsengisoli]
MTRALAEAHSERAGAPHAAGAPLARRRRRIDLLPYALVAPFALFVVLLAIVPAAWTIGLSFFHDAALDPPVRFAGFQNFITAFSSSSILQSSGNTVVYMVVGVVLSTIIGTAAALLLQTSFRGRSVVIAVLILPWALPGIVAGLIWVNVFDANTGLLNSVLTSLHVITDYRVWVGDNRLLTVFLIELVQVWQMVPLSALLILAALQNVPDELYEAARLDGCSGWALIRRISVPLARPGIAIAAVQSVVATLNIFDQPYALNGQADAGASLTMQTYFVSFQNLDFGQGYALALVIAVATVIVSFGVLKLVYRQVEY